MLRGSAGASAGAFNSGSAVGVDKPEAVAVQRHGREGAEVALAEGGNPAVEIVLA